jgi:hypothetical protein
VVEDLGILWELSLYAFVAYYTKVAANNHCIFYMAALIEEEEEEEQKNTQFILYARDSLLESGIHQATETFKKLSKKRNSGCVKFDQCVTVISPRGNTTMDLNEMDCFRKINKPRYIYGALQVTPSGTHYYTEEDINKLWSMKEVHRANRELVDSLTRQYGKKPYYCGYAGQSLSVKDFFGNCIIFGGLALGAFGVAKAMGYGGKSKRPGPKKVRRTKKTRRTKKRTTK